MNFDLPPKLISYLNNLDSFIESTILPLQHTNDNNRFFDHRREYARTDWARGGLPVKEWEELLGSSSSNRKERKLIALLDKARIQADKAGFYRFALPKVYGGQDHPDTNLWMSAIRFHLASHPVYGGGLGLANDLQNEHSVVGNFPDVLMIHHFGSEQQRRTLIPQRLRGEFRITFGLTEPEHGSDATFLSTVAKPIDGGFEITGRKKWQTGAHTCTHLLIFARTSAKPGEAKGITAFLVPRDTPGVSISSYEWTFNMPTDHATVELDQARVPASAVLGRVDHGLAIAQTFVHENRIRQAASSCGAAKYCLDRSIERARSRKIWGGKSLADNQAIQFPVVELMTQVEMLRLLILKTSWEMDRIVAASRTAGDGVPPWVEIERKLSDKVAMCNFWANRLCCQAADRAIQV
jgi:alkylation response protein AidB-like acyl-CoA dehydrogenase